MKKNTILLICVIVLLVACLVIGVVLLADTKAPTYNVGIVNPNDLDAMTSDEVLSGAERDEQESAKPQRTEEDLANLDDVVLSHLTRLDFSGLSAYLMAEDAGYQTDQHIQDLKVDLANTLAATETTAPMFLLSYRTPEMLAAAVAYFPMDYKLESFMSASSLLFPAQTQGNIELEVAEVSQADKDAMLAYINLDKVSYDRCTDVAVYYMRVMGLPLRLWLALTPDGWRPLLLEQRYNYSVNVTTQLEARDIKAALYRSGSTLEGAIAVQPFDEAGYLADMKAHPENYNPDRSRKSTQAAETAEAIEPDLTREGSPIHNTQADPA